jgi:hypothetical protein
MSEPSSSASRPQPSERSKLLVWARAAGRCTFCNRLVTENENLGELVPIGELAHKVGWSATSPRGTSPLDAEQRRSPDNLLLLCRNCHKPVDDGGVVGRYTGEVLDRLKRDHEERVRLLTEISAERTALIVRVVGPVRGVNPELSHDTVLGATTAAGYFPKTLPGNYRAEYDLDFRGRSDPGTPEHFAACAQEVDSLLARINDGIRRDEVGRLAIFALARIPVLVHLGARLNDKVPTVIFQRHRVDDGNAWRWPAQPAETPDFDITRLRSGRDDGRVALLVNLSGTVLPDELPDEVATTHALYSLTPRPPSTTGPTLIDSPAALASFEACVRRFLAQVEADHGKIVKIDLFPAIPISVAITLGRVVMPHVSPSWVVYDRNEDNVFFKALEVRR